jgi:hypothetical protein
LGFDLSERDPPIGNLKAFAAESLIGQGLSELDDAFLAGEDVVGVEAAGAHVEALLLPRSLLLHCAYYYNLIQIT